MKFCWAPHLTAARTDRHLRPGWGCRRAPALPASSVMETAGIAAVVRGMDWGVAEWGESGARFDFPKPQQLGSRDGGVRSLQRRCRDQPIGLRWDRRSIFGVSDATAIMGQPTN